MGSLCCRLSTVSHLRSNLTHTNKISACIIEGQSPRRLVSFEQGSGQSRAFLQKIAPTLALEVRFQEPIARCSEAVLENGVRNMSGDQERALDILLRNFEAQDDDLDAQTTSGRSFANCIG